MEKPCNHHGELYYSFYKNILEENMFHLKTKFNEININVDPTKFNFFIIKIERSMVSKTFDRSNSIEIQRVVLPTSSCLNTMS